MREVRRAWLPVVEGQLQYRRLSDNVDYTVDLPSLPGQGTERVTFAPAILNRYGARATLTQPVFTGFRILNRLAAAQAQDRVAESQVDATEADVVFQTRQAYWTLYEVRARRQAAAEALRQIERQLADVQNRKAAGMATQNDLLRVKARRDQIRVEQIQAQNAAASARRTLNDRMGRPLDAPVAIADTVQLAPSPPDTASAIDRAVRQRADLAALQQTVQARAAGVGVARSDWYPQISLLGSYLYARPNEQLFPPEDRFQGTWEAGVTLSWRFALGTEAAVDRAQARLRQARYERQDRRRSVAVEVTDRLQTVAQTRTAVRAAETSLESAREAYRSTQSRFDEGMTVVSDLLDAERALREARAQLAAAQADYARARAALDRALGAAPRRP